MRANPSYIIAEKLFGISVETSPNTSVTNNFLNRLGTGVRFFNTNAACTFTCNQMANCSRGITLESSDIGNQGAPKQPSDNQWIYSGGFSREADVLGKGTTPLNTPWYVRNTALPFGPAPLFIVKFGTIIPTLTVGPFNCK